MIRFRFALCYLGGVFASVAIAKNLHFCTLCVVFWSSQLLLALELVLSSRALSVLATLAALVSGLVPAAVTLQPESANLLANSFPVIKVDSSGPVIGRPAPPAINLRDGYVLVVTECPPCFDVAVQQAIAILEKREKAVEVLCLSGMCDRLSSIGYGAAKQLSRSDLDPFRVQPTSSPIVIEIRSGIVQTVWQIGDFNSTKLREENNE